MKKPVEVKWEVRQGIGRFVVKLSPMYCIFLDRIRESENVKDEPKEEVLEDIIAAGLYELSRGA